MIRTLVNLFICAYLLIAMFWHLPRWTFWRRLTGPLAPVVEWLGLGQHWALFAPDPTATERTLQVVLRLRAGNAVCWEPARVPPSSRWRAFLASRRRLYELMILSSSGASARPGLAGYLLRKYRLLPEPVDILFVCTEQPVARPGQTARPPRLRTVIDTVRHGG